MPASTRVLYERKLHKLLQSDRCERLNEADKAILYSDSEEEEKQQEKDEDLGMTRNVWGFIWIRSCFIRITTLYFSLACTGSEKQPDPSDQTQQESSQVRNYFRDFGSFRWKSLFFYFIFFKRSLFNNLEVSWPYCHLLGIILPLNSSITAQNFPLVPPNGYSLQF